MDPRAEELFDWIEQKPARNGTHVRLSTNVGLDWAILARTIDLMTAVIENVSCRWVGGLCETTPGFFRPWST